MLHLYISLPFRSFTQANEIMKGENLNPCSSKFPASMKLNVAKIEFPPFSRRRLLVLHFSHDRSRASMVFAVTRSRETVFVRINSSLNPPPSRKEKEKERNALANRGEETLIKFLARLYAFKSFSLSLFLFQSNVHELRPLVQFLHAAISALYLLGGNPCATIYSKADFSESIGHGESTGWWRE